MTHPYSILQLLSGSEAELANSARPRLTRPVTRILRAGYIGEIIRDELLHPPIHHWLVQDCDTNEIVALGQAETLSEAQSHAVAFLDDLRLRRTA